jgi:hypothetical protein
MTIVVGLDVYRAQITYDGLSTATGEVAIGRVAPADRASLRTFLRRWAGEDVEAAVEATTGWRFVVEELQRAGAAVQLAEPADTTAARGPKRRAKTDKRRTTACRPERARVDAASRRSLLKGAAAGCCCRRLEDQDAGTVKRITVPAPLAGSAQIAPPRDSTTLRRRIVSCSFPLIASRSRW